jgi:hypothetical protein
VIVRDEPPPSSRRPSLFRSPALLRALNIAAVALSLAGVTGALMGRILGGSREFAVVALSCSLPTLVFGLAWARLLRSRAKHAWSGLRWGWIASVPLAALNSGVASGLYTMLQDYHPLIGFLVGVFGATFGAILWIPALLLTLVCFGIPIASAQRLAAKGLAGEEHGERTIGIACAVMSSVGLVTMPWMDRDKEVAWLVLPALLLAGAASGVLAAALASGRATRRRRFMEDVEAGAVAGYRIDAEPEGKVLVRVTPQGQGYRVADFEEELLALDEEGEPVVASREG